MGLNVRLKDRVAIVTGAAQGIGKAYALRLAEARGVDDGVEAEADGLVSTAACEWRALMIAFFPFTSTGR